VDRILGKRIQKLHIKEFSRTRRDKEGLWKGFDVPLTQGEVDWAAVMKATDDIGYTGWAITEQGGELKDLSAALDKILAAIGLLICPRKLSRITHDQCRTRIDAALANGSRHPRPSQ
jgi:sugar phosphate isomerase/epimerase